jgi:hypothetical protein
LTCLHVDLCFSRVWLSSLSPLVFLLSNNLKFHLTKSQVKVKDFIDLKIQNLTMSLPVECQKRIA